MEPGAVRGSMSVGGPASCEEAAKRCTAAKRKRGSAQPPQETELRESVSPIGRNTEQTVGPTLRKGVEGPEGSKRQP